MKETVSLMDLFPTILEYLGKAGPEREGCSLRPLLEGRKHAMPDFRVSEWAGANVPNFMVRTSEWKLMMAKDPASRATDALFDLKNDPLEMANLLGKEGDRAKYRKRADEMKDRLLQWLSRAGSPLADGVRERALGG